MSYIENPSRDLFTEIIEGKYTNLSADHKFGRNSSVGTSDENVNDIGGTYTYSSAAATYYISSSSGSDTDQTITVVGIDSAGDLTTRTVNLVGQTQTTISGGTMLRIFRAYVSSGSGLVGDVYIYENDTVTSGVPQTSTKIRAKILIGNNQTQMAQFSTPNNTSMKVYSFLMTSGKDNTTQFKARIRPTDGSAPWRIIFDHDTYRSPLIVAPKIPYIIPANYDVEVLANTTSGTTVVGSTWDYVLEVSS